MLIIWKERLKQVAITMIIITPFLVERVCYVMIWVMNVLSRRREWSSIEFKGNETVRCTKIAFSLGEESHRGSHFVSIEIQQTLRKETNYEYFTFGTTFCSLRYSKSL